MAKVPRMGLSLFSQSQGRRQRAEIIDLYAMKKLLRISSIIFGIVVIIIIVWIALALYIFTGVKSYVPEHVYSPDKSKVVIPSVDYNKDNYNTYLLVHIDIQDVSSKKILFQIQTRASDKMRWSVSWIDNKTVILNSSDIGPCCWKEEENGIWEETKCP